MGTNLGLQEEVAVCRLPVTPGAAHGLHVALEARGQPQVQHRPHVWSVQPHPKGHGGDHHPQPALHEGPLHPLACPAAHAGMVGFGHSLQDSACKGDAWSGRMLTWESLWGTAWPPPHLWALGPRPRAGRCEAKQRHAQCPLVCCSKR